MDWDNQMAAARQKLDWEKQFELALVLKRQEDTVQNQHQREKIHVQCVERCVLYVI